MPSKVIPIRDSRSVDVGHLLTDDNLASPPDGPWHDQLGRPLRDLRISVTDRCNFRCSYCMPKEVFNTYHQFLPHSALLSFEEITRLARIFVAQGVRKIRLTGGEPLLRKNIESLVGMLAELKTPQGEPLDLTLTTNASVLAKKAQALKDAGLQRVTVSLDALDDAIFRRMNDVDFPVSSVLAGIEAAQRVGLGPIKVNMVVQRGVNEDQIVPLARHFRGTGIILRFIEYMDVGSTNQWQMDQVVPSAEVIERLSQAFPLEPMAHSQVGETAERWRYRDGGGEVGVISSVTHAFCSDCNRARLSTEGRLYTCLFAHQGVDLREPMRAGEGDDALAARLRAVWTSRTDRYSELRTAVRQVLPDHVEPAESTPQARKVEMHYIGG